MLQQQLNKNQQRYRTMAVFINNCIELMEQNGIENLSIRKVAKKAGYNSATIYHYFSDFEDLIICACLRYVDNYAEDLAPYLEKTDNYIKKYLNIWECFCRHSYSHPREFRLLFFGHMDDKDFAKYFNLYYEIYPDTKSKSLAEYTSLLNDGNIYDREYDLLSKCLKEAGYDIPSKDIYSMCEMNLLIYRGVLSSLIENPGYMTPETATEKTLEFVKRTLKAYLD